VLATPGRASRACTRPIPEPEPNGHGDRAARVAAATATAAAREAGEDVQELHGEKMVLNMGPSHPSTHGVLRILLELDGEIITKAMPDIGYLHRGDEKIAENMTYTQFIPYTDRLDYLAPLANNVAYALAVEKLMGIDRQLPPRCQYIRVICCELARISAHLLGVGCFAMDVGALTVFMHTFTEREKIYNLAESLTGARFTTSYTRIGGLARDLPPGWVDQCQRFIREVVANIDDTEKMLTRNRIWVDRTRDVGVISREMAVDYGLSGPNLRGSGVDYDVRRARPYLIYDQLQFEVPLGSVGDCYDRYLVRMEEMRQSVRILHQCLDQLPGGPDNAANEPIQVPDGKTVLPSKQKVMTSMEELIHQFMLVTQGVNAPAGEVYFGAENPKGELGFYINSRGGGTPYRMKIRSPSFVNLSILPAILPGHMMSDVVSILGSFDFVMGECDR
jgi:NADH-quinone oxidoreductase subunit D